MAKRHVIMTKKVHPLTLHDAPDDKQLICKNLLLFHFKCVSQASTDCILEMQHFPLLLRQSIAFVLNPYFVLGLLHGETKWTKNG